MARYDFPAVNVTSYLHKYQRRYKLIFNIQANALFTTKRASVSHDEHGIYLCEETEMSCSGIAISEHGGVGQLIMRDPENWEGKEGYYKLLPLEDGDGYVLEKIG